MILYEQDGDVGVLWLNRPAKHNAQNAALCGQLRATVERLIEDQAVRVLVVQGRGPSFSSGADLDELDLLDGQHVATLANAPFATIAAIDGACLGGGLELALACDMRIATDRATFGLPEVSLGFLPGWGGLQRLPRLVGPGAAKQLIFTAQPIDAQRALAIGLVQQIVAADQLADTAHRLAAAIAANAPIALTYAKEAMHAGLDLPLAAALGLEGDLYVLLESTADRAEGIAAFREKRRPRWTGT